MARSSNRECCVRGFSSRAIGKKEVALRGIITIIQALAIWWAQLTLCSAASFDCRPYIDRRACPEMVICSEPSLSRLDEVMASLYREARDRMPDTQLSGFRDYQREWLGRRGGCGCSYQCLNSQYRTQIDALRKTINQMSQ
jgi:uncharacterized protein